MTAKPPVFVAALLAIAGVVCVLEAAPQTTQAVRQAEVPGLILGRVVDATTGSPISSAIVRLTSSDGTPVGSGVLTGSDGKFVFSPVLAGTFTLTAQRPGYFEGQFGRKRATGPGAPLVLRGGERRGEATIQLWPWATISGLVVDEMGRRVPGVPVEARRRGGDGTGGPAEIGVGITDARGEYQIQHLLPGKYVIAAICRSLHLSLPPNATVPSATTWPLGGTGDPTLIVDAGRRSVLAVTGPVRTPATAGEQVQPYVYVSTYYGGGTDLWQVAPIEVTVGQVLPNIDIKLALKPSSRIGGTVVGPKGAVPEALIRLISTDIDPSEVDVSTSSVVAAVSGVDGSFRMPPVPRGNYLLDVYRPRPSAPAVRPQSSGVAQLSPAMTNARDPEGYWTRTSIIVTERDVPNMIINVRSGARIAGQTSFTKVPSAGDTGQSFHLMLEHNDDPPVLSPAIRLDRAGQFEITGVRPGWYVLSAIGLPAGWEVSSALLGGRDITGRPFEIGGNETGPFAITLGDRAIEIKGDVLDAQGRVAHDATVVIFSSDISSWKFISRNARNVQAVRTVSGGYSFRGLSAGEYYVAALDDNLLEGWPAPEVLRKLMPAALRLRVTTGERRVENLTLRSR
jgi:hypothetical protein